jgi:N-acetylglucosamine-6-phosphate deacetylase
MSNQSLVPQGNGATEGEVKGKHYLSGQLLHIHWRNGRITSCQSVEGEGGSYWLAPGLFDLQVNGYAGVDFQQDDLTVDQLCAAVRALREDGCPRFLLTLITDEWPRLLERMAAISRFRAKSPELERAIAGWHIEGPFLSSEPGFHGAHDPELMLDPQPEHLQALRRAAGRDPLLLTLAPERKMAPERIAFACSLGMRVSLGHTNASVNLISRALAAGAVAFTHLGNGCTAELNRHDNILWRIFDSKIPFVSLIPDGVHVSPPLFRAMHRVLAGDVLYVTDAMAAAAAPVGGYTLGRLRLEVGPDRVVRNPGSPYLAGSALRPLEGVIKAAGMLASPWQQAWRRFSEVPAKLMGLEIGMNIGERVNLCLIEEHGKLPRVQALFSS